MDQLPLNPIDLGVIAILLLSAGLAFVRGFVLEVLGIASWVGAALAALYGFEDGRRIARQYIGIELVADIVAAATIFIVVLIVLTILSRLVAGRLGDGALGPLNRSLGFLFGLLRGAVIVSLAWIALTRLIPEENYPPWILEARAKPLMDRGAELLWDLAPEGMRQETEQAVQDLSDTTDKALDAGKLLNQGAAQPQSDAPAQGYEEEERDALERLIERQGGNQ